MVKIDKLCVYSSMNVKRSEDLDVKKEAKRVLRNYMQENSGKLDAKMDVKKVIKIDEEVDVGNPAG